MKTTFSYLWNDMNILLSTSLCVHPYFAFRIFSGPQHRQNMQPNQGSKVRGTEDQEQQASFMSRNVFYPGVKTRGCDLRPGCFKFQPSVIILRLSLLQMNAGLGFLVWILSLVNFSPFFSSWTDNALWNKSNGSYVNKDFGTLPLIFSTSKYSRSKFQPCPSFLAPQVL